MASSLCNFYKGTPSKIQLFNSKTGKVCDLGEVVVKESLVERPIRTSLHLSKDGSFTVRISATLPNRSSIRRALRKLTGKQPKSTYKTIKRNCAKRNK